MEEILDGEDGKNAKANRQNEKSRTGVCKALKALRS